MSTAKQTPCEKLGYKTGDKFTHTHIRDGEEYFTQGQVITLIDDGTGMPQFGGVDDEGHQDYWWLSLEDITPYIEAVVSKPESYLSKLRDKIAMQQLGLLTPIYWEVDEAYSNVKELIRCQVESAYEYADEMLRQRSIGKEK